MAYCYLNGEFVDESSATLSIHSLGLHRGFGVFDFFRARSKHPTFFEDYLDRFAGSQQSLNLSRMITSDEIRESVGKLQELNGYENSSFKLILLGEGTDLDAVLNPFFLIINLPFEDAGLLEGTLIRHEYVRENPLIKNLNYFTSYQLHQRKRKANATDVLYHNDGIISEASRSNFFVIKDGILLTPANDILHGVTRKNVLKMASEVMKTQITNISLDDLKNADEAFLTSTIKEIMPIVKIEDQTIGAGKAGAQTLMLRKLFKTYISDYSS